MPFLNQKAFTLIELLITISIISILSVTGLILYQSVTVKTRDTVRINALKVLATALEIYFQKNHKYVAPIVEGIDDTSCQSINDTFYATIAPSSNSAPKDPATGNFYCYVSVNNGQSFRLFAKLENCTDPNLIPQHNCQEVQYNYSLVSDDLTITSAPGD